MKRLLYKVLTSSILSMVVCMGCSFTCHAQNGPTTASATLTWTNSPAPTGQTLSINNVYRCTQSGTTACTPTPPAVYTSTAPITTWKDLTVVASSNYNYTVTETTVTTGTPVVSTESGYSNVVAANIPAAPGAPTLNTPTAVGENNVPHKDEVVGALYNGMTVVSKCQEKCDSPSPPTNVADASHTNSPPIGLTVARISPGTK